MARSRSRRLTIGTALIAVLLGSCSGAEDSGSDEPISLTVATFGEFGYEQLLTEYDAAHPELVVESVVSDFESHHRRLATNLGAGRGAADIVAIEEQYMPKFRQSPDKFANLADFGAPELRDRWTDWKWAHGLAEDGRIVLGLGTDMGSLAMCYRRDLFAAAGLPTDRADVAALWPTWEDYAATADKFSAATPDVAFADSAGTIYTAILNQAKENYFSAADDSFIADTNPALRRAFTIAGEIGQKGQSAGVTTFTQPWNVAIKRGDFATITCPAWLLTQIEDAGGPELAGNWDVTEVPGDGGNWGGSYLTVPGYSPHQQEAYELAAWLTAPEQQKRIFLESGILPSSPAAYEDEAVLSHTDEYFHNAPVGQLFAQSANQVRPNYRGLHDAEVRPAFGHALGRIEDGEQTIEQAWAEAVSEARAALN